MRRLEGGPAKYPITREDPGGPQGLTTAAGEAEAAGCHRETLNRLKKTIVKNIANKRA